MSRIKKILARSLNLIIIFVLIFVSFFAGLYFSQKNEVVKKLAEEEVVFLGKVLGKYSEPKEGQLAQDIDFGLFWEVWSSLYDQFVDKDKLNEKKMFYGAIRGMVGALNDPYTVFMNPKIAKEFSDDLAGTFEGIGAEIGVKDDILTIIAPLPDMPAEKAGLKAGDKVYAIDGESTAGISIDEAVNKIRGPKGTEVALSISRNGIDGLKDIVIKRDKIIVKSIRRNLRDDNIYMIRVTNFNNDTISLFSETVRKAIEANPEGIILDLRNNPGGYLEAAIEMASEWIEEGVVVIQQYGDERQDISLARGRARLKNFPTVVLINQGSASASEIVSGALQDYGLAEVVGKKTFGKGSVQVLNKFGDGSSVKITIAKWLTPEGRSINDEGIEPDYDIDITAEDYNENRDPQINKAIEILTNSKEGQDASKVEINSSIREHSTTSEEYNE